MKKNTFLLILFSFLLPSMYGIQAKESNNTESVTNITLLNIKTDFGAIGDGITSDHQAFRDAATYINNQGGNCELYIPEGIYRVGKQNLNTGGTIPFYEGEGVCRFENVTQVKIYGAGPDKSIIKFSDGFKYGYFDVNGSPQNYSNGNTPEKNSIGVLFHAINSSDFSIENLTLDGNIYPSTFILGGKRPGQGYQIPHDGIVLKAVGNFTINNVVSKRFARDGVMLINNWLESTQANVTIMSSIFDYNGRQGFSWTQGDGLWVENCEFTHTAKGEIINNPGSGLDIEPEPHFNQTGKCKNATFKSCLFQDNANAGLVAGGQLNSNNDETENIDFLDCTFVGTTNWSLWQQRPDFNYYHCVFNGTVIHNYASSDTEKATYYENCLFSDCYFNNQTGSNSNYPLYFGNPNIQGYLANNSNSNSWSDNVVYQTCTFLAYKKGMARLRSTPGNHCYLNDCEIIISNSISNYYVFRGVAATNTKVYSHGNTLNTENNPENDLSGLETILWSEENPAPQCGDILDLCVEWSDARDLSLQWDEVFLANSFSFDWKRETDDKWNTNIDFPDQPSLSNGTWNTNFINLINSIDYVGPIDIRIRGKRNGHNIMLSNEISLEIPENCFAETCQTLEIAGMVWLENGNDLAIVWKTIDGSADYNFQVSLPATSEWTNPTAFADVQDFYSPAYKIGVIENAHPYVVYFGGSLDIRINANCPDGHVMTSSSKTITIEEVVITRENWIDESPLESFQLFPNPSNGLVNIIYSDLLENIQIDVMDYTGKVVKEIPSFKETSLSISLEDLPSGTYFVRLNSGSKSIIKKLVLVD